MTKSLICVLLAAGVAHADPSPVSVAGPPPATGNKLPSGTVWTTLVAGHGPHPKPTDWIVYYGGSTMESRDMYYLPKPSLATNFTPDIDVPAMAVGEKRRYWFPASGVSSARVEDVELAAILGPTAPTGLVPFPPPSDAQQDASGDPYVIVNAGKPGAHADTPDLVFFGVNAIDKAGNHVDLGVNPGTQTLADVGDPAVAAIVRTMDPGEQRRVWLVRTSMFLQITLYSVEKRPQVAAPPDIAHPPASAQIAPGARFVVLAPGHGEPVDAADDVTLDYTVWSPTGRTIETTQAGRDLDAAYWLPAERMFVFLSGRPGHEGCEATDPVWAAIEKL